MQPPALRILPSARMILLSFMYFSKGQKNKQHIAHKRYAKNKNKIKRFILQEEMT